MRKIVQVLTHEGLGGTYVPKRIVALFDDGTIWEGFYTKPCYDGKFTWTQVAIPSMP